MQNQEYVYLGRLLTKEGAESLESFLSGGNPKQLGVAPSENSIRLSEPIEEFDVSKANNTHKALIWRNNYRELKNVNSYFMIGDSLDEIASNITTLAHEPLNESTYNQLLNSDGQILRDENSSFFGDNCPVLIVMQLPSKEVERLIREGLGERAEARYGTDISTEKLSEITISDKGLKEILSSKDNILYYGKPHEVISSMSSINFDPNELFNSNYTPAFTIGLEKQTSNNIQNSSTKQSIKLSPKMQEWYDAFVTAMSMPEEDREFMFLTFKEALGEDGFKLLMDYYNQNNSSSVGAYSTGTDDTFYDYEM